MQKLVDYLSDEDLINDLSQKLAGRFMSYNDIIVRVMEEVEERCDHFYPVHGWTSGDNKKENCMYILEMVCKYANVTFNRLHTESLINIIIRISKGHTSINRKKKKRWSCLKKQT